MEFESIYVSTKPSYVIIDTNVLLDHFETVKQLATDLERKGRKEVMIVIPGVVVRELDNMKAREKLGWPSRRATRWIASKIKEDGSVVKAQALKETCKPSGNWSNREIGSDEVNDDLVLDSALYCATYLENLHTILCTSDQNLCIKAEANGIKSLTPSESRWSSRAFATSIRIIRDDKSAGDFLESTTENYNTLDDVMDIDDMTRSAPDPDAMEVDDMEPPLEKLPPTEALRLLHLQVIEQYSGLLFDLAEKIGGYALINSPLSDSRWAPEWQKKGYKTWDVRDCLEFLGSRSSIPQETVVRVATFLRKPRTGQGSRPGHEWPPAAWERALKDLEDIGTSRGDPAFGDSLEALDAVFHEMFQRRLVELDRMRP